MDKKNWKLLVPLDQKTIEDLISITQYLLQNPRPGCFDRELPLAVSAKLIQWHSHLLREWFDILLPPEKAFKFSAAFGTTIQKNVSILMDLEKIHRYEQLSTKGNKPLSEETTNLTASKGEAFRYLRSNHLRIEQEHIRQSCVPKALSERTQPWS